MNDEKLEEIKRDLLSHYNQEQISYYQNLVNEKNTYDIETSIQYIVAEVCDTDGK